MRTWRPAAMPGNRPEERSTAAATGYRATAASATAFVFVDTVDFVLGAVPAMSARILHQNPDSDTVLPRPRLRFFTARTGKKPAPFRPASGRGLTFPTGTRWASLAVSSRAGRATPSSFSVGIFQRPATSAMPYRSLSGLAPASSTDARNTFPPSGLSRCSHETTFGKVQVMGWLYLIAGIVLFGGWDNYPLAGRVSFAIFFPLHAVVGVWIKACVAHKGKFLDNPLWYGVLILWLLYYLCS